MIRIFAKESKLIIVFFLTVIVLGSLLVYLSINNISNYKELTEKKISEEERQLAKQFSTDFQSELERLIVRFKDLIQKDALINTNLIRSIDTIQGVNQTILMHNNGVYLWPHFAFVNGTPKKEESTSKKYLEYIKTAQHHEFVAEDYKIAEAQYLLALKFAGNEEDTVRTLNAVSRLNMKMNKYESAFKNYALILTEFSNVTNTSGFPYAYFSISQLLKISDPTKDKAVQQLLVVFLSELSEGEIPLNFNTSEMLALILEWIKQHNGNDSIIVLEEKIHYVSNYLALIENYKEPIAEIINEEPNKNNEISIRGFSVLKPISTNTDELMLFKKNHKNSVGFIVSLEGIFTLVKQELIQNHTKFEYQIELVNTNGQPYFSTNNLVNFSVFSPYFNQHRVKFSLKNESLVEAYVFKRKLIYGIGFILLIGVMALGLIVLVQDVQRKRQMNRLRADFVSNVTHELKTPLTSIHMFAESILLGRVKSTGDLKKYAHTIVKESENLKRMINNILEFSRKENNKLNCQIKEANLSDVVTSTLDDMKYWLELNEFKVAIEIEKNVLAKVDPEGLKQALSNLISNAIKYSTFNKKLMVRLLKKEEKIHIEIEDYGVGIPKDKLKLIFEKFYRVNSSENESVSGTGLGLTVTRDIIEAQKGTLIVESILGKGSKFTIIYNA